MLPAVFFVCKANETSRSQGSGLGLPFFSVFLCGFPAVIEVCDFHSYFPLSALFCTSFFIHMFISYLSFWRISSMNIVCHIKFSHGVY